MSKKTQNLRLHSKFEYVTWEELEAVLLIDANILNPDGKANFIKENYFQYYVAVNVWVAMLGEVSKSFALEFVRKLSKRGLVRMIAEADALASELIRLGLQRDHSALYDFPNEWKFLATLDLSNEQLLQLLRFPKRLTVSSSSVLAEKTVNAWREANEACRSQFWREPGKGRYAFDEKHPCLDTSRTSRDDIRVDRFHPRGGSFLDQILSLIEGKLGEILKDFSLYYDEELGRFSSGVAGDADKRLISKLKAFGKAQHYLYSPLYPLPFMTEGYKELWTAYLRAVPKSYKTYRPIAMEVAYRQFHMQAVRKALEECLLHSRWASLCSTRDQEHNRKVCSLGASTGLFSTLDLTSASDLNSRQLVWRVFPVEVIDEMYRYISRYVEVPKGKKTETVRLHMFSSAGAAVTFIVEDMVFMAISEVGTELAQIWLKPDLGRKKLKMPYILDKLVSEDPSKRYKTKRGVGNTDHKRYNVAQNTGGDADGFLEPSVFGDDIAIDSRAAEFVYQLLELLGFRVSESKSFMGLDPGYREACGVEYFLDEEISCVYWPRKALSERALPESIASLCALQHRLWGGFEDATLFVTDVVTTLEPRMTTHLPFTDCEDLWGNFVVCKSAKAPVRGKLSQEVPESAVQRELHLALIQERSQTNYVKVVTDYAMSDDLLLEQYYYADFLRNGPLYDTDINSDLLGITRSRRQDSDLFRTNPVWGYIKE